MNRTLLVCTILIICIISSLFAQENDYDALIKKARNQKIAGIILIPIGIISEALGIAFLVVWGRNITAGRSFNYDPHPEYLVPGILFNVSGISLLISGIVNCIAGTNKEKRYKRLKDMKKRDKSNEKALIEPIVGFSLYSEKQFTLGFHIVY